MATNTNSRINRPDKMASEQPSYHDGSAKDPWNSDSGRPNIDNGQEYNSDGSSIQQPEYTDRSRNNSISSLRNAENNAIANREPSYTGSQSQPDQDSFYTGKGRQPQPKLTTRSKVKSFIRSKGAAITIALILAGAGIFLGTSNSILAPALSALLTSNTQTSYTSYAIRAKLLTAGMMNNAGGGVTTGFTGALKYSRIPNYLKSRLAVYGIEVNGSGKNTTMTWTHTNSSGVTEVVENIDANKFVEMYNDNGSFREAYTNAKRGRVATFFDKIADKIYQKLGISRNLFSKYKQTNDVDADLANYNNTMEPKFDGNTTNLATTNVDQEERTPIYDTDSDGKIRYDDDGNPIIKGYEVEANKGGGNSSQATTSTVDADAATNSATSMISSVAQTVGAVGTWACTAMRVGNMIAIAAAAQETYQSIQYFMGQMENPSKMMAGYGDESAINSFLNFLTTSDEVDVDNFSSLTLTASDYSQYGSGLEPTSSPSIGTVHETGAPIQASGMQSMLANAPTTSTSASNYSIERVIKTLGGAAAFGVGSTVACAGVSITTSILSLGVSVIPGVGLVKILGSFVIKFAMNMTMSVFVSTFLSFLIPTVAKIFFSNAYGAAIGLAAGQLLARGAAMANMREGRSGSGQSISGASEVAQFNRSTQAVIAQEAEVERLRRSPFDTSSPYTFLGSIAYSLLPTLTSPNITGLTSFIRSASTSLASLTGRVSADGDGSNYLTTYGDCPLLDTIGAVGDIYCNPIVTTDMSTIDMSPTDRDYTNVLMGTVTTRDNQVASMTTSDTNVALSIDTHEILPNLDCDSDGNCTVIKDSNLARYISYCDNRTSPPGVIDQNILSELNPDFMNSSVLNSIPIIGDLISILEGMSNLDEDHLAWANGERCGNTAQNSAFWNSEGKYYQRYIEDQRILEQMGAYEDSKNPVTAYEDSYDSQLAEQNKDLDPYVAYISRISGLAPQNAETVLAYVYYYDYVNNYDPSTRIATEDASNSKNGEQVVADLQHSTVRFQSSDPTDDGIYVEDKFIAHEHIIYADIRNRSYAA